jgi:acyl-CoA thioester hydrolase
MRLHVPITLRWSDIDAYAHVNNAAMLRLLEEVRIEAFWVAGEEPTGTAGTPLHVAGGSDAEPAVQSGRGTAVLDGRPGSDTLTLIAHQEIEYLAPIPYQRRPLDAEVWIGRLGGASMQLCYELYSPIGQDPRLLYTRAETTLVIANAADSKPRRITDAEREAWEPYLGPPVQFRIRR